MENNNLFLAFDFGAESSKSVCGSLDKDKLILHELYRFKTGMLFLNGHYYWNIYRFYEEIINALTICTRKENLQPSSIAVDTWGVDFGFLAEDDTILRIPYAYRDPQVIEAMPDFHQIIDPEDIYALTGISMQPFNSLYHLHALRKNQDLVLKSARRLMFLPDLLNFLLGGVKKTEFSFATTSQLFNPFKYRWEEKLLEEVGLDLSFMNEIIPPGTVLSGLKQDICQQAGIRKANLTAVCSHDTGSAIVAVPAEGEDWAYISSGTWSLMGMELDSPLVNAQARKGNFSNEGGAGGRYRFLKNIMGLWLLQQCRKNWSDSGREYSYTELIEKAEASGSFKVLIDPDHQSFYNPPDMLSAIDEFCIQTSQKKPVSPGEYARTIMESLALKYRHVLDELIEITGRKVSTIHIIGGGSRNKLLCQFTANATGKKIIAGPAEGTAAGNIMMQAIALGKTGSLDEARKIIRNSFPAGHYIPRDTKYWEQAYSKFLDLTGSHFRTDT